MNKIGKENLVMINDEEYVHCPVCGTLIGKIRGKPILMEVPTR